MSISITARRHLEKHGIRYSTISMPAKSERSQTASSPQIPADQVAVATILKDHKGLVMAIRSATHTLDLSSLNAQLHRELQPASPSDYQGVFADCASGVIPPLGEAYGFETVVDPSLIDHDFVYFASGNAGELIRVSAQDYCLLHSNAWFGSAFASFTRDAAPDTTIPANTTGELAARMRQRIEGITNLPPMPTMAQEIMRLNANPYAHAEDLARLVERDPSLSAQVVRYAQSPFYGYRGGVASVRQAISRVLGYDVVMNMALGIAAARPFRIEPHGPLGLFAFWRHATYTAALAQALSNIATAKPRPRPGTAYLAGLLHDMGHLLLGHFFPEEFRALSAAIRQEPHTPVIELERKLIGITHQDIGYWLMKAWDMPPEITTVIREHHNPDYAGSHQEYVQVVLLADRLLRRTDAGDGDNEDLPEAILARLGITEDQAQEALERILKSSEGLDTMVQQLVA